MHSNTNTQPARTFRAVTALAVGLIGWSTQVLPARAAWPDHVTVADTYVYHPPIKVENNLWGSPAEIYVSGPYSLDPGELYATTKCGSFVALLLKNTYPSVTDTVISGLTGSVSPTAIEWYNGINDQKTVSGVTFVERASATQIAPGDILASHYTTSGDTGHAMVVETITFKQASIDPPFPIPGVTKVNRYWVTVFDSSKDQHGDNWGSNPYPDSRDKGLDSKLDDPRDDTGIGHGAIALYSLADDDNDPDNAAPADSGKIVAWAWNVSATTPSFYYAVPKPAGSDKDYRPLKAGRLTGSGL